MRSRSSSAMPSKRWVIRADHCFSSIIGRSSRCRRLRQSWGVSNPTRRNRKSTSAKKRSKHSWAGCSGTGMTEMNEHFTQDEERLGLFVLGAMPDDERLACEEHLHRCEICQQAVREERRI